MVHNKKLLVNMRHTYHHCITALCTLEFQSKKLYEKCLLDYGRFNSNLVSL